MAAKCANIQSDNPRPPPPLNCQSDNINHSKKCGGLLPQQTVYFQETTKLSKLKNVVTLDHNESSLVFFLIFMSAAAPPPAAAAAVAAYNH